MSVATPILHNGTPVYGTTGTTKDSETFTPAANSLLVAVGLVVVTGTPQFTIADTFSGTGTWIRKEDQQYTDPAFSDKNRHVMYVVQVGATPGSGKITLTSSTAIQWQCCHFIEIPSGFDPNVAAVSSPSGAVGGNFSSSHVTSLTVTMSATPAASSLVVSSAMIYDDATGIVLPSGWTSLVDSKDVSWQQEVFTGYRNDGASDEATHTWGFPGNNSCSVVSIEIPMLTSPPTAPAAPEVEATNLGVHATVIPPANGGSPITSYSWKYAVNGGSYTTWGSTTSIPEVVITGLTVGDSVTIKCFATTIVGNSSDSSASSSVTIIKIKGKLLLEDGTPLKLEAGGWLLSES